MAEHKLAKSNSCAICTSRCTDVYERTVMSIQGKLNRSMGSIGAFVTRRPVWVVVLSVLAAAAAGAGWARFRIESAADILWVPQKSQAMKDSDWVSLHYESGGGYAQVLASVLPIRQSQYGNNALQVSVFWELFQVDTAVRAINITSGDKTYSWTDVCEVDYGSNCKYTGPLNLWSMNFTTYLTAINGSATDPTVGNPQRLIQAVNSRLFPDNTSISTLSIFGGVTLSPIADAAAGPHVYMSAAVVISLPYSLRDGLDSDVENKWYDKFLDLMKEKAAAANYTALAYISGSSVGDEIGRSVTNDLYLIIISVAIFILVAVVGLSRFHLVGTRSSLAVLGVVSAILAMVAGYGFSLLFGCPFNTLSQTLPYVLLGLSVDCMFILVKAYDGVAALAPGASLEARFRSLMSSAGSSVVVTLLVSAVAFGLGAISELPAVQWFSAYATMGVLCILIATLTFFTGVFVLTERRIARNRLDCCCCATSGGPLLPTAATQYYEAREDSKADSSGHTKAPKPPQHQQHASPHVYKALVIPGPQAIVSPPPSQTPPFRGAVAESVEERGGTIYPGQSLPLSAGNQQGLLPQVSALDVNGSAAAVHPHQLGSSEGQDPTHSPLPAAADTNLIKFLFGRYYAPLLSKWYVKVLVLAVFIGWAVLCGVGIPRLKEGQPLSELAPDDSYLQDYVAITSDTFQQQIGSPAYLYFRGIDPSSPDQQDNMLKALSKTLENEFVNSTISAFQGNWLIEFIQWVHENQSDVTLVGGCSNPYQGRVSGQLGQLVRPKNITGCVPQALFYPRLSEFLGTRRGFQDDVLWTETVPRKIWTSRMPVVHAAKGDNDAYGRELINSIRGLERDVNDEIFESENADAPDSIFLMYNGDYIYDSGDAVLGSMTMEYVLLAIAGVGLVLTLTLPSLRAVVFMMISVGLVDYFLFGQMFILGLRFNQVSIINMIMATGLSVDYSVYFAQRFVLVTADGTLNGRMVQAMADTGSAVFLGGLTALMGTIPLAFSSSTILRVFFSLIFGTICFALLVGLMLMPVLFSLIGPPPLRQLTLPAASTLATTASFPDKGTKSSTQGPGAAATVVSNSAPGQAGNEAV